MIDYYNYQVYKLSSCEFEVYLFGLVYNGSQYYKDCCNNEMI